MSLTRASAAVIKTEELIGFRNKIINGAMEIAQRGTTFTNQATTSTPNGPYTLDRWMNNRASDVSGLTVTQSTDAPQGFINSMRLQRVAGNTATEGTFIFYTVAREDSIPLAGKTVTLSFYAKAGANYSRSGNTLDLNIYSTTTDSDTKVYLFSPTVTVASQNFTITTSWQRFSTTVTLGSTIKQLGFQLQTSTLTGTAGADDSWYATGFQLEEGSVATPFERRPYGLELQLCQRYYYKTNGSAFAGSRITQAGYAISTTVARISNVFPVRMRTVPSALEQSGTAGQYSVTGFGTVRTTCSAVPAFADATAEHATTAFTVASGLTAWTAGQGAAENTTTPSATVAYLAWNAEL